MNTINPEVFKFYRALEKNNNREWFEPQKKRFKVLEAEIKAFNDGIKTGLEESDEIEKVKIFRIYRDVRFSKNKAPYKTHFGISFHRKKPNLRGGYYLHVAPQNSFIATGFWNQIQACQFLHCSSGSQKIDSTTRFLHARHHRTDLGLTLKRSTCESTTGTLKR